MIKELIFIAIVMVLIIAACIIRSKHRTRRLIDQCFTDDMAHLTFSSFGVVDRGYIKTIDGRNPRIVPNVIIMENARHIVAISENIVYILAHTRIQPIGWHVYYIRNSFKPTKKMRTVIQIAMQQLKADRANNDDNRLTSGYLRGSF